MKGAALLLTVSFLLRADEPQTFIIQGTVTNSVTGELLRRANVHLQGAQNQTAIADAGGHFSFSGLPPGGYSVSSDKPGFGPARRQTAITAGNVEDLKLELPPLGRIAGQVLDENGDPVMNATVQIFRSAIFNGRRQTVNQSGGITNDLGEFHVSSLVAGRYFVGATGPMEADGTVYPRMFYGGTIDISAAAPIELRAGGESKATINLKPVAGHKVIGKIVNMEPNQHPSLNLVRKGSPLAVSEGRMSRLNVATGEFEFGAVSPGAYSIHATALSNSGQFTGMVDVVVSDGDAGGIIITLAKAAELAGVVRGDPDGTDIRGVSISARPSGDNTLASMGAQVKEDGSFLVGLTQPGDYFLAVNVSEPRYVKSIRMGGQEVGGESFTVSQAGAPGSFEVVIGTGGGQWEGTVQDGKAPAANVSVLLVGKAQERVAQTDSTGSFRFTSLAPGDYVAYAIANLQEVEYKNPEAMRPYTGSRLSVSPGINQRTELKLDRTVY